LLVSDLARIREFSDCLDPFTAGRYMVRYFLIVVGFLPQVVKEVIDPRAQVVYRENTADDPHKRKPDITKAKTLLGWEPKIALREGLPLMVDDFKERLSVQ
jgi:nucleoside-diphosphate-sugar epimerase